jgi:hypothetical protein
MRGRCGSVNAATVAMTPVRGGRRWRVIDRGSVQSYIEADARERIFHPRTTALRGRGSDGSVAVYLARRASPGFESL